MTSPSCNHKLPSLHVPNWARICHGLLLEQIIHGADNDRLLLIQSHSELSYSLVSSTYNAALQPERVLHLRVLCTLQTLALCSHNVLRQCGATTTAAAKPSQLCWQLHATTRSTATCLCALCASISQLHLTTNTRTPVRLSSTATSQFSQRIFQ
jgi:hypothetical protein